MKNKFFGFIGVVLGIVGVSYTISTLEKMNRIHDVVEKAANDLSRDVNVDISNEIVERAVDKAVNQEVGRAVKRASDRAVMEIRNDISNQVRAAVNSAYADLKDSVTKEIAKRIDNIDISDVKAEVIEKAKDAAAEKLNENLDDILEKFNDDLDNVNRIYKSIAKTISKNNDREMVFRIG